jgi:peptide/nickel transport system ATP-binding protein/oligopeptide transport system ATP-binding protein
MSDPVEEKKPVLSLRGLTTVFKTDLGEVKAVDGLDLDLPTGATLGIVGESGCGKSTVGLSIVKLIPEPPGHIASGEIIFEGEDLTKLSNRQMRSIRGNKISIIFQEPMTSLNPVLRIGEILSEVIRTHQKVSRKRAWEKSIDALDKVRIPSPHIRINDYPHEMSGGMRQRVMIALAICCDPSLIIADEPTTALDVTIQAQILSLLGGIKQALGTSIILITHNLGVIAENTEKVAVMYAGRLVEYADTAALFDTPLHPYTQGLVLTVPRLGARKEKQSRLNVIPGLVPNLLNLGPGCHFADRCTRVMDKCRRLKPEMHLCDDQHLVRCWRYA